jgi:hypothetical protein
VSVVYEQANSLDGFLRSVVRRGICLLAFGGAIACCSASLGNRSFWQGERVAYGWGPIVIALAIFILAIRQSVQKKVRRRTALLLGIALVILSAVLLRQFRGIEESFPEWNAESRLFRWTGGEANLPGGFTHQRESGMDTFVGHFTSEDGRLVISYDIGELAGEHGGFGKYSETTTNGSRVRIGRADLANDADRRSVLTLVSFPDSGCANFRMESPSEAEASAIALVARTFRPTGRTPPWLRPLLPEALRSDCRYRLRWPFGSW